MPYQKTIWESRAGDNLDKFIKYDETADSVILVNAPDSITRAGTPFSPENMNKIETGIEEAHNFIDAEFNARTEADQNFQSALQSEHNARQTADQNLLSALESEFNARTEADQNFQTALLSEHNARQTADQNLQEQIGALQSIADMPEGESFTQLFASKQDKIAATGSENLLTAPETPGGPPGTKPIAELAPIDSPAFLGIPTMPAKTGAPQNDGTLFASEAQVRKVAPITFIVDSNDALAAWATNAAGNNYSRVLIKSGTWTYNDPATTTGGTSSSPLAAINLATTSTLSVVGEAGSRLVIKRTATGTTHYAGIRGRGTTQNIDYYLENVYLTVELKSTTPGEGYSYGFCNCVNLIKCHGYANGASNTKGYDYAFHNCKYLSSCYGYGSSNGSGCGFYSCDYISSCYGTGYGPSNNGYGFYNCKYLSSCYGRGESYAGGCGFYSCKSLNGCDGYGTVAVAESTPLTGYGFYACEGLTLCAGQGTATNAGGSGQKLGYGFAYCRTGFGCTKSDASTTLTFYNCLMEQSAQASNPSSNNWANTAAGGFNLA
jgi:hypothetical protein